MASRDANPFLPANAGDARDAGSIFGSEKFPGEGNDNPLQYSCLENPINRGARQATVRGLQRVLYDWARTHKQGILANTDSRKVCLWRKHMHELTKETLKAFFFFTFFFLLFFLLFFFYCSGFCHTLKWNSNVFTCVPHPDPPSNLPLHPLPLGLPSAPGPSACLRVK